MRIKHLMHSIAISCRLNVGWSDWQRLGWLGQLHCFSFASIRERVGCASTCGILGSRWIYSWRRCGCFQAPSLCWAEAWKDLDDGHHGCFGQNMTEWSCYYVIHDRLYNFIRDLLCLIVLITSWICLLHMVDLNCIHCYFALWLQWCRTDRIISWQGYITPEVVGKLCWSQQFQILCCRYPASSKTWLVQTCCKHVLFLQIFSAEARLLVSIRWPEVRWHPQRTCSSFQGASCWMGSDCCLLWLCWV